MSRLPVEIAARWAPVLEEAATRLRLLKRTAVATTVLDPRHVATKRLGDRLLDELRGGMRLCAHFDPASPSYTAWAPGNAALSCLWCTLLDQNAAGDPGETCDLCTVHKPGEIAAVAVAIGPVGVMALTCLRCRTERARSPYNLASAGRQVIGILEARRRGAS